MITIEIAKKQQNPQNYQAALAVRQTVFVAEQGFESAIEVDQHDENALHFVLYENQNPIGVLRLFQTAPAQFKIGRVAILKSHRHQQLGQKLMQAAIEWARSRHIKKLTLSAQQQTLGFYRALGFEAEGELDLEEGVLHQKMSKLL